MMENQAMGGLKTGGCTLARRFAETARRLSNRPFWGDRRGVAAVEFAFLAPLLICMYFMSMEVSQGIETSKKASRVASMVADLITQQPSITKSEVDAVLKIGGALLQPYNRSQPTIIVTGIQITTDATPKVLVSWSRKVAGGVYSVDAAKNTATTVPDKLNVAGSFLIRVQSSLSYTPVLTWAADGKGALGLASAFDGINMGDTYYLRPRMSDTVPCGDC